MNNINKKTKIFLYPVLILVCLFLVNVFLGEKNIANALQGSFYLSGYAENPTAGQIIFGSAKDVVINGITGDFSGTISNNYMGIIDFSPTAGFPSNPEYGVKLDSNNNLSGWGSWDEPVLTDVVWIGQYDGILQYCDNTGSCTSTGDKGGRINSIVQWETTLISEKRWINFDGISFNEGTGYFSGNALSDSIGLIDFNNVYADYDIQTGGSSSFIGNISGYAWSDNIGWVSFNPADYGSSINYGLILDEGSGEISGYVWSDNIGWIDFSPTSGYPESPNSGAILSNSSLIGWVRALSYGDGWDGWIKLSDTSDGYGVSLDSELGNFSGYAWGSDIVGWVSFDGVTMNDNQGVTLYANPETIRPGDISTLHWTSTNMSSCDADWLTGTQPVSGTDDVSPAISTTYVINCIGSLGNGSATTTILVSDSMEGIFAGDDTIYANENSFINANVLSNDVGEGLQIIDISNPTCGATVNNTNYIRYTNTSYCGGSDSFNYTIQNSLGETDTANVSIIIYQCGDGIIQLGEQCDAGASNGSCPNAACSNSCTINTCCGDGTCSEGENAISCPLDCSASIEEF